MSSRAWFLGDVRGLVPRAWCGAADRTRGSANPQILKSSNLEWGYPIEARWQMSDRFLHTSGVVAAFIVVSLAAVPARAQAPQTSATKTAGAKVWTPSRTQDGQPDLQGTWV